jgi:uncharacterized Tic20 family protein
MDEPTRDKEQIPESGWASEPDQEARTMAMLAHLLGAFLSFLGPLIIWLIKKDDDEFIDEQGKEALNFQLTLLIAYVAAGVLWMMVSVVTCGIGAFVPLPLLVTVLQVVFGVIGAVSANRGEHYRYPMTIRMIS